MTDRADGAIVAGAINPVEGKVVKVPSHQAFNEKQIASAPIGDKQDTHYDTEKEGTADSEIQPAPPLYEVGSQNDSDGKDHDSEDVIIRTGADAATHLLPMRDDHEPALTFRSIALATILSGFQAVVFQIYQVRLSATKRKRGCVVWANTSPRTVQTNPHHDSGHVHCHHRLLSRQRLGKLSPQRRSARGQMESKGQPRQGSTMGQGGLLLQPWTLEPEGALHLLHHRHIREQRSDQHPSVCSARPLLRFVLGRHHGDPKYHLHRNLWIRSLRDYEANSCLVRRAVPWNAMRI